MILYDISLRTEIFQNLIYIHIHTPLAVAPSVVYICKLKVYLDISAVIDTAHWRKCKYQQCLILLRVGAAYAILGYGISCLYVNMNSGFRRFMRELPVPSEDI